MKKSINIFAAILLLTFVVSSSINAQTQKFAKGDKDINLGIGFGSPWISSGLSTVLPQINATFDLGLRDDWGPGVFGVGAYVGTSLYRSSTAWIGGSDYGYRYFNFVVAARATYHYTFVENLDTYGGAVLGFNVSNGRAYGDWPGGVKPSSDNDLDPVHEIFVGAKYYFSGSFAAFSELSTGSSIPYLTIGVALKL